MDVGGHTIAHIAYHLPEENVAFVGDALFSLVLPSYQNGKMTGYRV